MTIESRKSKGLCIQCSDIVCDGKMRCRRCLDLAKAPREKRRNYVIQNKLCVSCGRKTNGKRSCDSCLAKGRDREKKRNKIANDMGICCQCRKADQLQHASVCKTCYLKTKSRNNLGDSSHWQELLVLLELQGWLCPYTGDKLVLGFNDSVDHKFPRTKFPEQSTNILNLEWTTRGINQMKADRTKDEFVSIIRQIAGFNPGFLLQVEDSCV